MSTHSESIDKEYLLLPGTISSIEPQKNNAHRFSIFVKDEFLIGIAESVLRAHNLEKGTEITAELFDRIKATEETQKIRDYFFRLLGRRDHSSGELRTKAIKKGFREDDIQLVLHEFEHKNYIDDEQFARRYVNEKLNLKGWGPFKIKNALFKKGINKRFIENSIKDEISEDDLKAQIRELVRKNRPKFLRKQEEKRQKKIFDFFLRKGYDSHIIINMMPEIMESLKKDI